jgi:hypothetical protein
MIMNVEQLVEWELAAGTEMLGKNLPLCPPQIPHDLTWNRTRTAVVGSWRLTAWAMARLTYVCISDKLVQQDAEIQY